MNALIFISVFGLSMIGIAALETEGKIKLNMNFIGIVVWGIVAVCAFFIMREATFW